MISCSVDGTLKLWKTNDLSCLRTMLPPKPSELAGDTRRLRQQIADEEAASLEKLNREIEANLSPGGESKASGSNQMDSPIDSPLDSASRCYGDRVSAMQEDDGSLTSVPVEEAPGSEGLESGLAGQQEAEEMAADEEDEAEEEEDGLVRDMPGAGGFTQALLWGNIVMASAWDGGIRVWVYSEYP